MKKLICLSIWCCTCLITSCASTQNASKDGSTPAKAIKVNSIKEEYQYARKACQGCTFESQALVYVKKQPYDVLYYTDEKGNTRHYYFDISSFFGLGF